MRREIILLIIFVAQCVLCANDVVSVVTPTKNGNNQTSGYLMAKQLDGNKSNVTVSVSGLTSGQTVTVDVRKYGALDTNTVNTGSLLGALQDAKLTWDKTADSNGKVWFSTEVSLKLGNNTAQTIMGRGFRVVDKTSSNVLVQGAVGAVNVANNGAANTNFQKATCELMGSKTLFGRVNLDSKNANQVTVSAVVCGLPASVSRDLKVRNAGDLRDNNLGTVNFALGTQSANAQGVLNVTFDASLNNVQQDELLGFTLTLQTSAGAVDAKCVVGDVATLPPLNLQCGGPQPTTSAPATTQPPTTTTAPTTPVGASSRVVSSLLVVLFSIMITFLF